ncbi:MAG: uroporphyrinogen-III C-methyltransferase [Bacteroidales bacterium]|jgi:uroporphyrinogen III methyltransferase/synthase
MAEKCKVYIIGFGPGDPELMTVKADRILHQSQVIIYDDLINKDALNKYKAEKIYVGKRKGLHSKNQEEINQIIYKYALEKNIVVRLKGGDPMIFGRGGEEYQYLKQKAVEVDIIPGITSALAAAAYAAIPLTNRGISSSVAFCTGHPEKSIIIPNTDTIVFYMAASNINIIIDKLIESGRLPNTPIALIENISMPEQQIVIGMLNDIIPKANMLNSPLLIIVGEVVKLNYKID